jgi:phosphoglycerate dehydrogenase-like enzyme
VTSTPEQSTISVAELAIGLMISLARQIPADADTKQGNWNRQRFFGTELYGKTFGIIGAGRIGLATARRAQVLGMQILAHDPFVSRDNAGRDRGANEGAAGVDASCLHPDADERLSTGDVINEERSEWKGR